MAIEKLLVSKSEEIIKKFPSPSREETKEWRQRFKDAQEALNKDYKNIIANYRKRNTEPVYLDCYNVFR